MRRFRASPLAHTGPLGPGDLTTSHRAALFAVGVITVLAVAGVALRHRGQPALAALLILVVASYGLLTVIDLAEQRLPDRITLPLAAGTMGIVLADGLVRRRPGGALVAIGIGLAFAAALLVLRFGLGDVKLALTVGTIAGRLGGEAVRATVLGGSLAGAVAAGVLLAVHRRRDVTFGYGPVLALGSVAGMLVAGS